MEDRLILLSEIKNGWSVIGQKDKYLSPLTIKNYKAGNNKLTVSLKENAPFVIYSEKPVSKCKNADYEKLGDGFYLIKPNQGESQFIVYNN